MKTKIVSFCGKKQAGKDSAASFLAGLWLSSQKKITDFWLSDKGYIVNKKGLPIDCNKIAPNLIKIYHFADELKNTVSKIFNIDINLLNGTDEDKNTTTHISWESLPGVVTNKIAYNRYDKINIRQLKLIGKDYAIPKNKLIYHDPGFLTIRELLQYFGTDICRAMYEECWVNATMHSIKQDSPQFALVADTRFDNEAEAVKLAGGINVFLSRGTIADSHKSENGFINFHDWSVIVHNEKADLIQFKKLLYDAIFPLGISPQIIVIND